MSRCLGLLPLLAMLACAPNSESAAPAEPSNAAQVASDLPEEPQPLASANETRLHGEDVEYEAGGVKLRGYLAYDATRKDSRPGVLVVHEWWGNNDYARLRAKMLAELGYTALALDMYGEGKIAEHPDDARKFAGAVMQNTAEAEARFNAALALLRRHASVDPDRVAAIGYCFGGSVVLHMARSGADLDGVVSFHGGLATPSPASPGRTKAKVLVCNGAADSMVGAGEIEGFKREMRDAGVDFEVRSYEGAKHAFTNPNADALAQKFGLPLAYDAHADRQSWQDMQSFLAKIFADAGSNAPR